MALYGLPIKDERSVLFLLLQEVRVNMFSDFYRSDLHNQARVALANLRWSIDKNRIEGWTFIDLVMGTSSACLLIS